MIPLQPLEIGLVQGLVMAGAVLGFVVAFRLLDFPDLTVEASLPLGAATYAVLVQQGIAPTGAAFAACGAGMLAGATTAGLHVRFGVNKLLAGIIIVGIAYSLTLRVMAGPNRSLLQAASLLGPSRRLFEASPRLGVLLVLGAFWLAVAVLLGLWFRTRPGIQVRAAGTNPALAESLGLPQGLIVVAGLAACNGLAALSGALLADHQGFADVSLGQGVLILALAAMAIGEALVPDRRLSYPTFVISAALTGSIAYQVIVAYAVRAGLAPTDLRLATGVLVLAVVAFRFSRHRVVLDDQGAIR